MTIGPVVLRSIAPMIHAQDGRIDCHLMVDNPAHHFPEFAESGGDSVTFHVEAVDDVAAVIAQAREHGLEVGVAFNPGTEVEVAAEAANLGADLCLCMSINPGYSGQEFMEDAYERIERLRTLVDCFVQVDGGVNQDNVKQVHDAGADLLVVGSGIFAQRGPRPGLPPLGTKRWHELAAGAGARREAHAAGPIPSRRSAPSSSPETRSSARARPRPQRPRTERSSRSRPPASGRAARRST